jgi:hypothetical protein
MSGAWKLIYGRCVIKIREFLDEDSELSDAERVRELDAAMERYEDAVKLNFDNKTKDTASFYPSQRAKLTSLNYIVLDRWIREEYPAEVRVSGGVDGAWSFGQETLRKIIEWKFQRGRRRNMLVPGTLALSEKEIRECSKKAFKIMNEGPFNTDRWKRAREAICTLNKIGPASASAIFAPLYSNIPYFTDEVVEACFGNRDYNEKAYDKFRKDLSLRAAICNKYSTKKSWTPERVQRALWAWGILTVAGIDLKSTHVTKSGKGSNKRTAIDDSEGEVKKYHSKKTKSEK